MKLFDTKTNLTSFKYPVVKIIICLSVITLGLVRNSIFQFSSPWINAIITILFFVITIPSILCIYVSITEILEIFWNRKKANRQPSESDTKQLTIEAITKIVTENDIVEIEVYINNQIIDIGASAECKYTSAVFENKLFYISTSEYATIEMFTEALTELFPEGIIPVLRIDDLPLV